MTDWRRTTVAPEGTHHLLDGRALYAARFREVLKFHAPGLAPVRDDDSAWHIDIDARPTYAARYIRTFGFYEDRAAVEAHDGWHHILADGTPLATGRYAWCGNFQYGRCPVRDLDGGYVHIELSGRPAYSERHLYAGDFRDGAAVVRHRMDGLCRHIDRHGREIHGGRFMDLDVFHKAFARARDERGWFHVDHAGRSAYDARFANVEPFYNGFALAWTATGARVLIDERGKVHHAVHEDRQTRTAGPQPKVLVLGNVGAGKSTILATLAPRLGWRSISIDACRRAVADGTPAGELRAWATFVAAARSPGPALLECTGSGPQVPLLRLALRESGDRIGVLWVRAPVVVCRARAEGRPAAPPYPDFGVPVADVAAGLDERIAAAMAIDGIWHSQLIGVLDGTTAIELAAVHAEELIGAWRRA